MFRFRYMSGAWYFHLTVHKVQSCKEASNERSICITEDIDVTFAVIIPTDEESVHSGVPKLLVGQALPGEYVCK